MIAYDDASTEPIRIFDSGVVTELERAERLGVAFGIVASVDRSLASGGDRAVPDLDATGLADDLLSSGRGL